MAEDSTEIRPNFCLPMLPSNYNDVAAVQKYVQSANKFEGSHNPGKTKCFRITLPRELLEASTEPAGSSQAEQVKRIGSPVRACRVAERGALLRENFGWLSGVE